MVILFDKRRLFGRGGEKGQEKHGCRSQFRVTWRDLDLSPSRICSIARLSDVSKLSVLVSCSVAISMHTLAAAPVIPFLVLTTALFHYPCPATEPR